jgi:hypothetical protein
LLGYLLSRPGDWQVRHDQLQHKLGVGRKLLTKLLIELEEVGYLERDEVQGRDEYCLRPTTTSFAIFPSRRPLPVHLRRCAPSRSAIRTSVIRKKRSKLILLNLSPNPFPSAKRSHRWLARISIAIWENWLAPLATIQSLSARGPIGLGVHIAVTTVCPDLSTKP